MPKNFSERKGLSQVNESLQVKGMSDTLRNSIWNALDIALWSRKGFMDWDGGHFEPRIRSFSKGLWFEFFKRPIDTRPSADSGILKEIRHYFFNCAWNEVYDFIEFVCHFYRDASESIAPNINYVLERDLAAYRIIDRTVVEVTDEQEIAMLEEAMRDAKYEGVNRHLKRALELMSDRKSPDYRNSIKESISAVESMANIVVGRSDATLGDAIAELEKSKRLHPALKQGFSKLYGYTSDEQGIRHAMLDEPNLSVADAKYFLLSCTSFVNYLKAKI